MTKTARRRHAPLAFALAIACHGALAQDGVKPKSPAPGAEKTADNEIARYCANLAPSAAEARLAYQTRLLTEMDAQVKQRIAELEQQEADARDWVMKREALLKSATEDVVAIYAKMPAEAAAAQVGAMDDTVAASILMKLNPRVAGGILGEMDADKAAKLTGLMAGPPGSEKKS
jgi:flagellar motility protein MotE (MotC chaperone)